MIKSLEYEDCLFITRNMRKSDRDEIFATRWDEDPDSLARAAMLSAPFAWAAFYENRPAAAIGGMPKHPGVWQMWMFATDEFPFVGFKLTKFARRVIIPALVALGVHRVEAYSIEGHTEAQSWMEYFGGRKEATFLDYGKNRQTFHCYSWRPQSCAS